MGSEQEAISADDYIRERLLAGVRDADVIAKELTEPRLRGMTAREQLDMLAPVVKAYAHNRVRGWQRAIEHMASEESLPKVHAEASGSAAGASNDVTQSSTGAALPPRRLGPPPMTQLEARKAHLSESIYVPGKGNVWNRDATREDFERAIVHLESVIAGSEKTIAFYRRCIAAMEKHHVATFGEVPVEEPLD